MKKILKNKKGFTLIEIIVVLVIIAILAAATVPAMLGFVSDARGKAYAAEARVGLLAAQAAVTEMLATGTPAADIDDTKIKAHKSFINMIDDLGVSSFSGFNIDGNRVDELTYVVNGYTIKIANGTTTVTK